jgi:excinuclease UvrABC helicase subunit UvrB
MGDEARLSMAIIMERNLKALEDMAKALSNRAAGFRQAGKTKKARRFEARAVECIERLKNIGPCIKQCIDHHLEREPIDVSFE